MGLGDGHNDLMITSIPVKAVFFDAVGTLFDVKGSVGAVYLSYAEKYGVHSSAEMESEVNVAFKEVFQKIPPPIFSVENPAKLKQCERLWWFDVVHAVFYRVGMFEGFDDFFEEVFEAFSKPLHWILYPETIHVLAQLKAMGVELGIISNFDTRFFQIARDMGLDAYIDTITISSLAGSAKPSPKIFQYALDQHSLLPGEAVHVGDSEREDFLGAKNAGLHALHLTRGACERLSEQTIPTLSFLPERIRLDQ